MNICPKHNIPRIRKYGQLFCNECHKENSRRYYRENKKRCIETRSRYQRSPKGKQAHLTASYRYWERFPDKQKAQGKVAYAIKKGTLVKEPCIVCGRKDSQAHHEDYTKPLQVKWLCPPCHKAVHHPSSSTTILTR